MSKIINMIEMTDIPYIPLEICTSQISASFWMVSRKKFEIKKSFSRLHVRVKFSLMVSFVGKNGNYNEAISML